MKKLVKLSSLILFAFSILFFGCEVGLGSSVDVDAPSIKIEYPPEAAVTRGNLVVKGTCSDDTEIAAIYVKLINSKTEKGTEYKLADFNQENWTMNFDTTSFTDGQYSVQAYAVDGANRESLIYSRSFDIDNTAPVLILSKPLALKGDTPSTYGRVLKLAGDISDEHTVTSLKFKYKRVEANGNVVTGSIDIADFKNMSSEDPLVIAQYYDDADTEKNDYLLNNYKTIYGDYNPGTAFEDREIYCTIELSDEAQVYDGTDSTASGNISTRYYINSTKFYDELMSEKSHSLTATRLMKIINGTYEDGDAEEIKAAIENVENKFYVESSALESDGITSAFKLNPDNNPAYLVGGFALEKDSSGIIVYNKLNMGSDLLLTVECGKDETYIDETSIVVTFKRLEDNGSFETYIPTLVWEDADGLTSISKEITVKGDSDDDPKDSTGGKFFKQGRRYIVEITGYDEKQVEIIAKDRQVYGFELATTSTPSRVETDFEVPWYNTDNLKAGVSINLKVTEDNAYLFSNKYVKNGDGSYPELRPEDVARIYFTDITIKQNDGDFADYKKIKLEKKSVTIKNITANGDYFIYDFVLNLGYSSNSIKLEEGNGKYKFIIPVVVSDTQNQSTNIQCQFCVDCDKPTITGFEEYNDSTKKTTVNGEFSVSGIAKDNNGLKKVSYKINGGSSVYFTDKENLKIDVDSTSYTDKNDLTIVITAEDEVGYKTPETLYFYVDQSTDAPVINGSNFDTTVDAATGPKYDSTTNKTVNIFNSSEKLTGYITDDDGALTSATINFYSKNAATSNYDQPVTIPNQESLPTENGKTFSNIKVPTTAGIYKVVMEAKDGPQKATGYNSAKEEFYIAVDNLAPTIKETKINSDAEAYTNGNVQFTVEVSDDWDPSVLASNLVTKVYKVADEGNTDDPVTLEEDELTVANNNNNITVNLDISATTYSNSLYKVIFTVTDRAGKTATVTRNLRKETTSPEDFTPSFVETAQNGYYGVSELTVEGTVTDDMSGIGKVEYKIGDNDPATFSITPNGKSASFRGLISGLKKGDTITVTATDKAGNSSTSTTTLTVQIDSTAPAVTDIKESGKQSVDEEYRFNAETTKTFTLKATDAESGMNTIVPSITGVTISGPDTDGIYTVTIPENVVNTTGALYVTASDKVGNSKDYKICNIIYDNEVPTADIKFVKYYNTDINLPFAKNGDTTDTSKYIDANGKVTISGTAKDTELEKVWLEYKNSNGTFVKLPSTVVDKQEITDNPQSWSFVIDTTAQGITDKKEYTFRVAAIDKTGNTGYSSEKKVYVDQDSDRPKITFTSTYYNSTDAISWLKQTKVLYLNVEDDDGAVTVEYKEKNGSYKPVTNNAITFDNDGEKEIYFKITENNTETAAVFESGATNQPKLIGNDGNEYTTSVLNLKVDTTSPTIGVLNYASKNGTTEIQSTDYKSSTKDVIFGGEHKTFNVQFKANDNNGIKKVELYKGDNIIKTVEVKHKTDDEKLVTISDIDVSGLASGSYEYEIIVYDYADMTRKQKFSITVDNTAPTISTDSHQHLETVGAKFTIKGSVDGSDRGSSIKYIIDATAGDIPVTDAKWANAIPFTSGDTVTTWRLYVDDDPNNTGTEDIKETHTPHNHKWYFVENYKNSLNIKLNETGNVVYASGASAGEPYVDEQPLYFHFLVMDNAGNRGTTTLALSIDPQGDIPTVKMDAPAVDHYGWYCNEDGVEEAKRWAYTDTPGVDYNSTITKDGHIYKYKGKASTLSGTINAQGSAEAKAETGRQIIGVYMQIDPAYNPVSGFNADLWTTNSTGTATTVRSAIKCSNNADAGTTPSGALPNDYEIVQIKTDSNGNKIWGIKIGDSSSWSKSLNQNNLFGYKTGSNLIAVRLYARDGESASDTNGKVSTLNPLNDLIITVDSDAPVVAQHEPFYLWQFAWKAANGSVKYTNKAVVTAGTDKAYSDVSCSTDDASITAYSTRTNNAKATITVGGTIYTEAFVSKSYDEGNAWINDVYWLRFSVHDQQDVYQIKVNNDTVVIKNNGELNGTFDSNGPNFSVERKTWNSNSDKGFIVNYRVGTTTAGEFGKATYVIESKDYKAQEEERKTSERNITINYDNKKPEVKQNDGYFSIDDYVVNNLGKYSFGTATYEDGKESGLRNILYYFKQKNDKKIYLLSKTGTTKESVAYTSNQDIYLNSSGTKVTAISGNDVTVEAVTGFAQNDMVMLGGNYYIVSEISGNNLKLDGKPSSDCVGDSVYGVIGKVLTKDNPKVTSSGNRYIWNAEIDSNTLPDGPIEINYIIFDKAGNYYKGTVDAIVGNNAPRIASVRVWCDKNRNTTKQAGEYADFFYDERTVGGVTKAGEATSSLLVVGDSVVNGRKQKRSFPTKVADVDPEPFMTVKDVFKITPEIVGGNGALKYSYVVANRDKVIQAYANGEYTWEAEDIKKVSETFGTSTTDGTIDTSYISGGQVTGAKFEDKITVDATDLAEIYNNSTNGNKVTYFEFTIWDSTPNLTVFTNSLHSKIQLALKVQYKDTEAPKIKVGKFGYDSSEANPKYTEGEGTSAVTIPYSCIYDMDTSKGHVELQEDWIQTTKYSEEKDKPANNWSSTDSANIGKNSEYDADPKVSGYISMRGIASDNLYIDSFKVQFPGIAPNGVTVASNVNGVMTPGTAYTGDTALENSGIKFTVIEETYDDNGHTIEWQCDINTAKVDATSYVKLDSEFKITVNAARGTTTTANDSCIMDVVPYIYEIDTNRSDIKPMYRRTARGHYPLYGATQGYSSASKNVAKNETATIKGFNMPDVTFTVADTTYSSNDSGYVYTAAETTITTLNNINYSDAEYNKVASDIHQTLTDDVYFDIWDINSKAAIPNDNMINDAMMKINPNNGLIGFAFCDGASHFTMANGTSSSYTKWCRSPDFFQCTGFGYNSSGKAVGIALGGDSGSDYGDCFDLFYSPWGTAGDNNESSSNENTGKLRIENMYQTGTKDNASDGEDFVKNRFASPSFATSGDYTYLAYYDRINKEIRFRSGEISDTKGNFGNYYDEYARSIKVDNVNNKPYKIDHVQVVAADDKAFPKENESDTTIYHAPYESKLKSGSTEYEDDTSKAVVYGGEYVSIATTSNNSVVMVWYDEVTKCLRYSYKSGNADGSFTLVSGKNRFGWSEAVNLTGEGRLAGEYCQVAVDSDNGVHIACFDKTDTALRYIYIPSYNAPTIGVKSCLVDSYLTVGKQITIDVAKVGSRQIPYIGYWGNTPKKPRYAYLYDAETFYTSSSESEYAGVVDDKYTGVWEVTIVPTPSNVFQTEEQPVHMNVGVWKNSGGSRIAYKDVTGVTSDNGMNKSTANAGSGTCYGNGTANGVMGYIVSQPGSTAATWDSGKSLSVTWIEVAQKRDTSAVTYNSASQ